MDESEYQCKTDLDSLALKGPACRLPTEAMAQAGSGRAGRSLILTINKD